MVSYCTIFAFLLAICQSSRLNDAISEDYYSHTNFDTLAISKAARSKSNVGFMRTIPISHEAHDNNPLATFPPLGEEGKQDVHETCKCGLVGPLGPRITREPFDESHADDEFAKQPSVQVEGYVPTNHPWLANIIVRTVGQMNSYCSGSLLNHRYVLTSSYCLCQDKKGENVFCQSTGQMSFDILDSSRRQFDVYVGILRSPRQAKNERYYGIQIFVPYSRRGVNSRDIALLKLSPWVTFSETVSPICLASWIGVGTNLVNGDALYMVPPFDATKMSRHENQYCQTTKLLPKPFHSCKTGCSFKATPGLTRFCQRFLSAAKTVGYKDPFIQSESIVVYGKNNHTSICYPTHPGEHGWCYVKEKHSMLDYENGSDWGYCSETCPQKHHEEVKLTLLDDNDCAGLTSSHQDLEFCAGQQVHMSHIQHFDWMPPTQPRLVANKKANFQQFVSEGCKRSSGSPAIQYHSVNRIFDIFKGTFVSSHPRSVQVGISSKGSGCDIRIGPYTNVEQYVNWIDSIILDGGCARYI